MAGMGLEGAYGAQGTFDGLRQWMRDRRQQTVEGQQDADRLRTQGLQDQQLATSAADREREIARQALMDQQRATEFGWKGEDRAADIASADAGAQDADAMIAAIDAINDPRVTPLHKLGAKISIKQGKPLPPQLLELMQPPEPVKPRIAFAPDGRAVDMNDPSILGQTFRAPQTAAPREDRIIPVQTVDEKGQPVTKYLPESQVRGQTFAKPSTGAGPTLTAPMRKALVDADVAGSLLNELKTQFDGGAKNVIGPMEGRMRSLGQTTGISVNQDFAKFSAATARLRNATIQAITGAAMGEKEAERIMAEIPSETDHPDVWPIKYAQAMKNLDYLKRAIGAQAGGAVSGTADDLAGAGQEFDWVDGRLVPR